MKDEKLRIETDNILRSISRHEGRYPDEDDAFHAIEQAFLGAGYVQVQPAEGELVPIPDSFILMEMGKIVGAILAAQHAYDKARIETLEIDYQMLSEEAKELSDELKELKRNPR